MYRRNRSTILSLLCLAAAICLPDCLPENGLRAIADDLPAEVAAESPPSAEKAPDSSKSVKVYILVEQSNMVGMGKKARDDVFFVDLTNRRIAKWMPVGVTGRAVGLEVQFGFLLGDDHDETVLVTKAAQGNRSISFDVMPSSSRIGHTKKGKFFKGWQYDAFVGDIHELLGNLSEYFPNYKDQGYEVSGFYWCQGHKDGGLSQSYNERRPVNRINDLRTEFKAPKAPFVGASVGFDGKQIGRKYREILKAQLAGSDPDKYLDFAGNGKSIDTRPFWRTQANSPGGGGHRYDGNAETYTLVGDSLGRAMIELIKKKK
jgi:hypothetical protein